MLDLAAFQRKFVGTIESGNRAPEAFAVYRNTSMSALIDALRSNYPIVEALVGSEMFDGIAFEFANAYPPRSPVLAAYGGDFAGWIEVQPWLEELAYLADVARIERLHIEALFAADAEPLRVEALVDIEPARWTETCLHLHPAARFGWLSSPAMQIWTKHRHGEHDMAELVWHAEGALMTRPDQQVMGSILDAPSHRFLSGIRLGETAGAAAIAVKALYPAADIGSLFARLVNAGAFAASPNF